MSAAIRIKSIAPRCSGGKKIALLGLFILLLPHSGCQVEQDNDRIGENAVKVIPKPAEGENPITREFSEPGENMIAVSSSPKVPLDPGEKLLQVLNVNLDLDITDEQILILKKKGGVEAPITIVVVDFDSVRNIYSRTWESSTGATNIRTFTVTLKDLVGDHNLEIVCQGTNNEGELTLDVFRKTPSPTGLDLYFTAICQIVSDGNIEIQEIERSEGYRMGQKNGPSFPVFSYTQDRESENPLDRIKHSYYWQYQQNRYVLTSQEKLPGRVVEEKQLEELFAGTQRDAFEKYLAGPWYLSGSPTNDEMLLFLPEEKKISIFSTDVQEMYDWKSSFRSFSNRLTIFAFNEAIQSVRKIIQIEVISLNTIEVSIRGDEQWDISFGRYIKISEAMQRDLLKEKKSLADQTKINLSGLYRSDDVIEIIFEKPYFTWIETDKQFSGRFTIFRLNRDILYLKGLDETGLSTGDKTFIIEYSEKEEDNYLYRSLVLLPGKLGVRGVEPISDEKIIFEQIKILEKN